MPLKSIKVLDLSRLLPGPYCSMFLADFGAEVIKVEDPNFGDYLRWNEPIIDGNNPLFQSLNRNKKSISLNLKKEKGKMIFKKLVETADVVLETFRPGVMSRLGLGYEELRKINPKLIYCAITGYGQDGPYAQFPGHDINYLSYAGLLGLQGEENGSPVLPVVPIADIGGGSQMAAIGILLALQARNQTGEGQLVDISMTDGVISWMQTMYPMYFATKKALERGKVRLTGQEASYNVYRTSDNRYLSVGAIEEKFWEVFCTEINCPHLIDRLKSPNDGQQHLKEEIANVIKEKTLEEWLTIFQDKQTCISPVLTMDEVEDDPQVKHRNMFIDKEINGISAKYIKTPVNLSKTPSDIRTIAPDKGEHNDEVYKNLGYSLDEIQSWKRDEII